jgi:hypothetical protein
MRDILTILGVFATVGVLAITCLGDTLGLSAIALFSLGLLFLLVDSGRLLVSNKRQQGLVVLIVAIVLFGFSLLPWYGRHEGEPPGKDYHRHMIWKLGHVH